MPTTRSTPAARPSTDWASQLRSRGLRATKASIAVLHHLQASEAPLTHGELSAAISGNGGEEPDRVTLYRVLERLEQADLVAKFPGRDGAARFAIRSAGALGHFECNGCHRVVQLSAGAMPPKAFQELTRELQRRGVTGAQVSLAISGICAECRAAGKADLMVIVGRVKG